MDTSVPDLSFFCKRRDKTRNTEVFIKAHRHLQYQRNHRCVTLSRNGKVLLTCCDDGTVWRWDRVANNN
ncbi:hypothetical protein RR46_01698 [Papilio xuthus]|uniref:Uncharacterized protein n=1 Tax=Papilio xuthus TaxID=66420 RepID=A0A194QFY7_PAPXU|nr:hypothetical protein RR46_01698 [Papilio xuthus]